MRGVLRRIRQPWWPCVRVLCCSQLRFMWWGLMLLTAVCVVLQILGVVQQTRKVDRHNAEHEQLVSGVEIHRFLPYQHQDWEHLRPTPATVVRSREESETPKRGLESERIWSKMEAYPFRYHSRSANRSAATKAAPVKDTIGQSRSDPDVVPHPTDQSDRLRDLISLAEEDREPIKPQETSRPFPPDIDGNNQQETFTCRPKTHIAFLKTHKTASSTVLSVLYRYGDSHNLTFALPRGMNTQLFYPAPFAAYFVEGVLHLRVPKFDIICNHMRFSAVEVKKLMPKDTFYFSILRNPVDMMESIFVYYKAISAFHGYRTLDDFLLHGGQRYNMSAPNSHYARNLLAFDFGHENSEARSEEELDQRSTALIADVEWNFDLILISEYFDESMVLLRHALCWKLEDVVSFRLNSRSDRSRRPLHPDAAERIKAWSPLDWRLYLHFNATFWKRIDSTLGRSKLQEEVELLRTKRAELQETCLLGGGAVDPSQVRDQALKPFQYGAAVIQGYNLRPGLDANMHKLCQRMITPELQYTSALYAKQFPHLLPRYQRKPNEALRNMTSTHTVVRRRIYTQSRTNTDKPTARGGSR